MMSTVPTIGSRDSARSQALNYFIDPANPQAGHQRQPLCLDIMTFAPHWENFVTAWNQINFPRMFGNTLFYAVATEIGVLISCTLVAYGFARSAFQGGTSFPYPHRYHLLPATVTIIPTYTFLFQDWLRERGCRSSCRPSLPMPLTCSFCGSSS
jgi:ABC-type glycerol-3-phosphate transport system permease component